MKKTVYKLIGLFSIAAMLYSCSLDEYNPSAGDAASDQYNGWYGLQSQCYSPLYHRIFTSTNYLPVAETGTDTWEVKANGNSTKELFYYESLTTSTNPTNQLFRQLYTTITSCNEVINKAQLFMDKNPERTKILVAEAKTLRAFYYLSLVTQYGPITLNLDEAVPTNFNPKRNSEEEIYTQIVKDLSEAAADLQTEPLEGNYARVTKKSALGLLARAYAQGGGLGLSENGKSYWQRAKEVATDLIDNAEAYKAYLYEDISDMWADANNRNNKESLFTAAGPQAGIASFEFALGASNLFALTCGDPGKLEEFWNKNHRPSDKGYFYGRMNDATYMPSKYLMDCFDPSWDKRWENSFMHAYSEWSIIQPDWGKYEQGIITITQAMVDKYGMNPAFVGEKTYPYADCDAITYDGKLGGNQYPASVWPKGKGEEIAAMTSKAERVALLEKPKKVYVVDYPIAEDDDRFNIVLSKEKMSKEDKWKRKHLVIDIDDFYTADGSPVSSPINGTNIHLAYPSLNKFNWSFAGAFMGSNLQRKYGDMFIMRMAEVYLIAAEAEVVLGNGAQATKHLNKLRKRAMREGANASDVELTKAATLDDVFDEHARELCGEFSRWALLKRHKAFETRLAKYNKRAAASFKPVHYNRPISYDFLSQINNKEEYGDNGYGTTANSGLDFSKK